MVNNKEIYNNTDRQKLKTQTTELLINISKNLTSKDAPNEQEISNYQKSLNKTKKFFYEKAKKFIKDTRFGLNNLKNSIENSIGSFIDKILEKIPKKDKKEAENFNEENTQIKQKENNEKELVMNETWESLLSLYWEIFDIIIESIPEDQRKEANKSISQIQSEKDRIVKDFLESAPQNTNIIFDGFPRSLEQAKTIEKDGISFDCVIHFDIDDETIRDRILNRLIHNYI